MFWKKNHPKLQIRSPAYDTCATCFKFSCNLSAIHGKAKESDIVLNLKDLNLGESEEVEQGQEADLDILYIPTLINRTAEDESDEEDSYYATSDGSSLSSAQEMNNEDDGSSM